MLLVAQDDAAQDKAAQDNSAPDTNKQDEPASETAPDSDEKPAANESPASDDEPTAAQKSGESPAETTSPEPAGADKPAADAAAEDESTAIEGGTLVGGTRAKLEFPQSISHEPLAEMIKKQLADMNSPGVPFRLQNPNYQPGSDAPLRRVDARDRPRPGPDSNVADDHSSGPGRHAGVSRLEPDRRQGGRRHANDGPLRDAGQHVDDRALRVGALSERRVRAGRGGGPAARRAGLCRVPGNQRLSVAVSWGRCWSIRSRSVWPWWRRC